MNKMRDKMSKGFCLEKNSKKFDIIESDLGNCINKPEEFDIESRRDLIRKILVKDVEERLTIEEILEHEFFKNGKEIGVFKFYANSSSQHPTIIKTYSATKRTVLVEFFKTNGILESKGYFLNKKRK